MAVAITAAAAALLVAGCGGEPEDPRVTELREQFGLRSGAEVHWVTLAGDGALERVRPERLEIEEGDVVVFETADWRAHTLGFRTDSLGGAPSEFLLETGQAVAPPLVTMGSRFVVTFADAPEGDYPYRSEGGGGSADGIIVLRPPER
jgi:plastocyanin